MPSVLGGRKEPEPPVIIGVIDGQDGVIGARITGQLKDKLPDGWEVVALGTNATATRAMLDAGADQGATGEGAIVWNSLRCAALAGPLSVVMANSMMGEFTPRMAEATASSPAEKFLVPLTDCEIQIAGVKETSAPELIADLAERIIAWAKDPRESFL
jgi:Domain of unknown function (DUF3842)